MTIPAGLIIANHACKADCILWLHMVLLQACCSSLQLSKAPADIGSAAACTAVYSSTCSPVLQLLQVFWTDGHTATCMHMGGERRPYREQPVKTLTNVLLSNNCKGHIVH